MRKLILLTTALLLLTGCARSDFHILKPEPLSRRITDSPERIETSNMVYTMQAKENRLVVLAYNSRSEAVELLGDRSFVVDPQGASHPLRGQAIAPNSYMKLILPPLRPRFEQSPQWHFGVGTQIGHASPTHTAPSHPLYADIYSASDAYYWDWDGDLPIRLRLTYRTTDNSTFTDEFTITKVRRE